MARDGIDPPPPAFHGCALPLPAEIHPAILARHVLAAEGGVMLARAYRDVEAFDPAVKPLRDYFDRLLRDRAESDERKHEITKEKRARGWPVCQGVSAGFCGALTDILKRHTVSQRLDTVLIS